MINTTNMTYIEVYSAASAIDAAFSRALVAEYGVDIAGVRRYDNVAHENAVLEQLKQEKHAWSKALSEKAVEAAAEVVEDRR